MADEFTKAALYGIRTFNKKVKEKIGMMKLIELLNEFEVYNKNCEFGKEYNNYTHRKREEYEFEEDLTKNCMNITFILSKQYGFIKWLVENDKIDRDKKEIEKSDYDITFTGALTMDKKSDLDIMVDTLLMLLSISDTPIEDLLLYLK